MITTREYIDLTNKCPDPYETHEWHTHYEGEEEDYRKIQEYNKALCKEYPFLIPSNRWSGVKITEAQDGGFFPDDPEYIPDYDWTYTEMDNMPDGWRLAFGDDMLKELKEELVKYDYLNEFTIMQIKEKYGELRFYTGSLPVGKLSDDYEMVSIKYADALPKVGYGEECLVYDHIDNFKDIFIRDENDNIIGTDKEAEENNKNNAVIYYRLHKILERCKVDDIISKYEDLSRKTCIKCGKPATQISTGWISPWCDDCIKDINDNYVTVDEYFKREE